MENVPSFSASGYFAGWSEEEKDTYTREDIDHPASEPLVVSGAEVDLYSVFLNEYTIVNQSADVVDLRLLIDPRAPEFNSENHIEDIYYILPGESFTFVPSYLALGGFYFYVGRAGAFRLDLLAKDGSFLGLLGFVLKTTMVNGIIVIPEDYVIDTIGYLSSL